MQPKLGGDGAVFAGADQALMGDADRVERPLELALPELQEALELGKRGARSYSCQT